VNFEYIELTVKDRVAVLKFNRPDKKNALNLAARREISAALDQLTQRPEVRAAIVTGAGDQAFISGTDLNEFGRMTPLQAYEFLNTHAQRLYARFEELDLPVIAAINGLCLGGGCELALACDIRLAASHAKIGQPEILLGMIPGSGATQRLPRLVGQGKARELIFTGTIIDAEEALSIGLVNHVHPPDQLMDRAWDMAAKIASHSAFSLKMAKRSLRVSQETGLTSGLAYEALAETAVFCSPDREEGVNAFFEKRKPEFG
jgi:enoyl-CoA hydratase